MKPRQQNGWARISPHPTKPERRSRSSFLPEQASSTSTSKHPSRPERACRGARSGRLLLGYSGSAAEPRQRFSTDAGARKPFGIAVSVGASERSS
jgi:hypothetical protein